VDEAGGLHVGPRSAGAEPGPACYGRGGTEPTLTDANLVAGRLDPSYFLGGTMPLDPDAARRALAGLGERLGVDASAAARGVLLYAVAQMAHALRLVTVRRGLDPRDFTFVAYGGAGPLHAALLARELGVSRTLIPPAPGHFSAFGMLLGEFRADAVRTHLGAPDPVSMAPGFEALEQEASAELEAEAGERRVERFAQLRYLGQEHSLEVALPPGPVDDALLERLRTDLDRASKEHYAFSLPESPIEVVALRVSVTASAGDVGWVHDGARTGARLVPRAVDFAEHGGVRTAEVIERSEIDERTVLAGPCVVEEPATTILVLPGQRLRADGLGNLLIEEVSA
jgi:N-methylhydantoinase A